MFNNSLLFRVRNVQDAPQEFLVPAELLDGPYTPTPFRRF